MVVLNGGAFRESSKSLYLIAAPTEEWVHGNNVVFAKLQFPSQQADRVVTSARRLTWW